MEANGKVYRNLEGQVAYLTQYLETNALANEMGIKVLGRVDTAADLPVNDPDDPFDYGDAYMVGEEGHTPYRMYVWSRDDGSGNPGWFDIGYFPTAPDEFSIVEVNGQPVHEWDADTKLDKYTEADSGTKAYVVLNGSQGMMLIASGAIANAIAARTSSGAVAGPDPTLDGEYTTKKYADDHYVDKKSTATTFQQVYAKNTDGSQYMQTINITNGDPSNGRLAIYGTDGRLRVGTPVNNKDATPLGYIDSKYNKKRYLHTVEVGITATNNWSYTIQLLIVSSSDITITTSEGIRTANIVGIKGLPGYDTQPSDFFGTASLGTDEGYPYSAQGPSVTFIHADGTLKYFSGLSTSAPEVTSIAFVDTVTDF